MADPFSPEAPFGPRLSFSQFLEAALRPHVLVVRSLYAPPQPGFEDKSFLWLTRESGPAPILGDVRAAAWDERGLAAGLGDGQVRVFSDWPCPGVALPARTPVERLSWASGSPYAAVAGQEEATARVFDLRQCGEIAALPAGGKIRALAVSPAGARLALVDEARRLRLGPLTGPLENVASLRFEPLDLSFTPQDGGLLAVDAGGWVTLWNPDQKRLAAAFQIPGAPFVSARLAGRLVSLVNAQGETVLWDVPTRQPAAAEAQSPLFLADGVLFVRGEIKRWVKQAVLRPPVLEAAWSARLGLVRVRDVDGRTRYYDLARGEPAPAPARTAAPAAMGAAAPVAALETPPLAAAQPERPARDGKRKERKRRVKAESASGAPARSDAASPGGATEFPAAAAAAAASNAAPASSGPADIGEEDWLPVLLDEEGGAEIRGQRYSLADPVFRRGDDLLLCRAGPDGGFFLWWRKAPGQPLEPRVGELPVRRSIRADAPPQWLTLSSSAKAY